MRYCSKSADFNKRHMYFAFLRPSLGDSIEMSPKIESLSYRKAFVVCVMLYIYLDVLVEL